MKQKRLVCGLVGLMFIGGCSATRARPTAPIPASSPLASIREGMGLGAVIGIMGAPTDQCTHATGKAFIPFYFGGDTVRTELHYKGQGRILLGTGAFQGTGVSAVEYDPTEAGYCGR
jgi:hypothetical protein